MQKTIDYLPPIPPDEWGPDWWEHGDEDWEPPRRKRIRKKSLLRMLKQKPYEPFCGSNLPDRYLLNSVAGASPSIKLFSLLQAPEVEYPSIGVAYCPFAD